MYLWLNATATNVCNSNNKLTIGTVAEQILLLFYEKQTC